MLNKIKQTLTSLPVIVAILIVVALWVSDPAMAWKTGQSAEVSCTTEEIAENSDPAIITVTFRNKESDSSQDMKVVVTDLQTGLSVDLGIVPAGESRDGEINTGLDKIEDGKVRFDLTWADDRRGQDVRYAEHSAIQCQPEPSPTPTSTKTPTPSPTPTLTPSPTPTMTVTPSPSPTMTPTLTPTLTASPTVTPTSTLTPTPVVINKSFSIDKHVRKNAQSEWTDRLEGLHLGDIVEFEIIAHNTGDLDVDQVRILDILPDNLTLEQGQTSWTINEFNSGEQVSFNLRAKVSEDGIDEGDEKCVVNVANLVYQQTKEAADTSVVCIQNKTGQILGTVEELPKTANETAVVAFLIVLSGLIVRNLAIIAEEKQHELK